MKKALGVLVLFASGLVAHGSAADGESRGPNTFPHLLSVRAPSAYTGGPLELVFQFDSDPGIEVTISSQGTVVGHGVGVGRSRAPSKLPPYAIAVTDPNGLGRSCAPSGYFMSWAVAGTPYKGEMNVVLTPSCTFTSAISDDWLQGSTSHPEALQKDNAFAWNTTIEAPATCTAGPKVKALVVNNSKISAPSLLVQVKNGATVTAQTPAAFPLAAGESKTITTTTVTGVTDAPALSDIVLVDWTHSLANHMAAHILQVKTARSCAITATTNTVRMIDH